MPIVLCAAVSLAIAWARGASPLGLGALRIRWLAVPVLAFALQVLAFVYFGDIAVAYARWVQLVSLGLLLAFLLANLQYRSLLLVAIGALLNLVAVTANAGYMPVRITDIERAGYPDVAAILANEGRFEKSVPLDERTQLRWLTDVIRVPLPGPDRMVSIGDVLVTTGICLFIQEALVVRHRTRSRRVEAG
ncbi:MAG: DUF5317 domain-containing protein [Chloroflexi bacterium]|nr:DUF5317 domain-containing protein [Chloroflexota bacterium]